LVTDLSHMFSRAAKFNQPLNTWDVRMVETMFSMFSRAESFNQPLDDWETVNLMVTQNMFSNAIAFNKPLGTWITTSLNNLFNMFNGASSFNQSIGDWKISSFGLIRGLLDGTNLSTANYDQTLISWSEQEMIPSGLELGAQGLRYCDSEAARLSLVSNNGWTFTGDNKDCESNDTCGPDVINLFYDRATGDWHDNAPWAPGRAPNICEDAIIAMHRSVFIRENAECKTLEVQENASLEVIEGQILTVGCPQ